MGIGKVNPEVYVRAVSPLDYYYKFYYTMERIKSLEEGDKKEIFLENVFKVVHQLCDILMEYWRKEHPDVPVSYLYVDNKEVGLLFDWSKKAKKGK